MAKRVTWNADGSAAYLVDENNKIVGKWFLGRPELSTFDPSVYQYNQPTQYTPTNVPGGTAYSQTVGGGAGGYYYPEERTSLDLEFDKLDLEYADREKVREESRRQFEETLAFNRQELEQRLREVQMQIASSEGMQREQLQAELQMLQMQIASNESIANLDRASREHMADEDLAMRLKEMQSRERITAAETWANPIDYLAYNKWLAGQQAMTTESGLPVGAPGWDTGLPGATPGQPEAATVGAGGVATGGADVYGQQLAGGGRIQEFGAWSGPTTPVAGTPWVAPHQANVAQFSAMPVQAQQMAYARWRQRGITPETAYQTMFAAAPTGTAKSAVAYG